LLDCIPMRIDSVAQDCPALALAAFELMQQLIAGNPPAQTAQVITPRVRWRSRR
ncbi:MAG: transcriptional regulator, partial [Aeromonas veronii]